MGLLLLSSVYWTWRLRAKLTETAPRAPQETLRLWFAWALVGIVPTAVFFVAMYQSTVVMPSRFIERLNRSLTDYHVAYSADVRETLTYDTYYTARGYLVFFYIHIYMFCF